MHLSWRLSGIFILGIAVICRSNSFNALLMFLCFLASSGKYDRPNKRLFGNNASLACHTANISFFRKAAVNRDAPATLARTCLRTGLSVRFRAQSDSRLDRSGQ